MESNSADVFFSKVSPGIFFRKKQWMPIFFGGGGGGGGGRGNKTDVLGAIIDQLLFSEGTYQLLNS